MYEPIDPPIPCPRGGWLACAERIELIGDQTLPQAIYNLATRARQRRCPQVALYCGIDLYAYPHQSTADISRSFQRLREMVRAGLISEIAAPVERWTARRKAALVFLVEEQFIAPADALAQYGVTAEELTDWRGRFYAHGLPGLRLGNIRVLAPGGAKDAAPAPPRKDAAHG